MILTDIRFCTRKDIGRIWDVDRTSPYPWPRAVIASDVRNGVLSYIGAFATSIENTMLGYAVLGAEKQSALLMNLVVLPEYRRRGIGMQLVAAVAECAADMEYRSLLLRVRESNRDALSLYKNLGFIHSARLDKYYSNGDAAYSMFLTLPMKIMEQVHER